MRYLDQKVKHLDVHRSDPGENVYGQYAVYRWRIWESDVNYVRQQYARLGYNYSFELLETEQGT